MSTQAIQAGEAFVQLNIKSDEFQKGLLDIGKKLEGVGSDVKKFTSLISQNFKSISQSIQPIAPMIELTGFSFNAFAPAISLVENLTVSFQKNITQIIALISEQGFAAAANQLLTASINMSTVAVEVNAAVWYAHPIMWIAGIIAGVVAITVAAVSVFDFLTISAEENAKAMEDLRKKNESYLTSAKSALATLQELSNIDPWQSDKKSVNLSAWKELQRTTENLGISLEELGVKFDANTGKIDASEQAIAKLKEAMRVKELNDLNAAIEAQEEHLDDLHSKLDKNGKVGWRRWALTYVTFGYYDNAEEIQKKIDEESQKLQENQDKRKTVVDFSAEYKENEAKLKEMYDKEAEASKNALAVKIDNIKTEFSEREAILRQLIQEAEVRDSLSFEDMEKLRERRAALAGLNAEQEERIRLLREEQAAKYQKIQEDYEAKKAENEENKEWHESLEFDPKVTKWDAENKFKEADSAFNAAIEAAKAIDENTSKEEIERLNAEVESTRKEADKWYARREEAAKKVADIEKKAAEDAEKAAEEQAKAEEKAAQERLKAAEEERKTRESRFKQIEDLRTGKQEERDKKAEQEAWKKEVQDDPTSARETAQQQLDNLKANSDMEYYKLQQLAQSGSDEDYQAQLAAVRKMEESIDLWQSRLDESSMKEMENLKDNTEAVSQNVTRPDVLLSGSVDTQKKFLELQQATKNPLEEKMDESNRLLRRVAESSENLEGQMEAV
ncbi:MAG: hypothetical protein IJQ31_00130 [Thermoguttaceae bacterium]|nr:hypothetical protein [Thermoguttaceae bacterium]